MKSVMESNFLFKKEEVTFLHSYSIINYFLVEEEKIRYRRGDTVGPGAIRYPCAEM